jgi:fatty-acid peroxygenase
MDIPMLVEDRVVNEMGPDHTMALMKEGYLFIKNRTEQYQCSLFTTHLMGEKAICMSGIKAAKIFYDPERFTRTGAAPKRIQKTLFGENAIQGMNGTAHQHRKQLFLSLMTPEQQERLAQITRAKLEVAIGNWRHQDHIVLFDEIKKILCASACKWAGVPLKQLEIRGRAEDFSAMVDGFGAIGPRHFRGRSARNRAERWLSGMIEAVRSGRLKTLEGTALHEIAFHNEPDGSLMNARMAAIELINVLRPIVAISTFITFAAVALHKHPECKEKLRGGNRDYLEMFAQEVRRFYPFTPFVGARVRKDFIWNECYFDKGTLVLLDIYGMNHDSEIWKQPYEFIPERFMDQSEGLFEFIPQGGGNSAITHRCPGEGITVEVMKTVINFLVNRIDYTVPKQVLSYPARRIPTLPESGFIMANIRLK